jgi:hypothetical protein
MKKPKRKDSRLTSNSSNQEIIRWTESRDVFDRLEKGVSEVVEDHSDLDEVFEKRFSKTIPPNSICGCRRR